MDNATTAHRAGPRGSAASAGPSGVGVLDKAVLLLERIADRPASLAELVEQTGLSRPTVYRLAVALEHHRLADRDREGRFVLGPWTSELAATGDRDPLLAAAPEILAELRDRTEESAQLYRCAGAQRCCIAAAERTSGLRDTVPVGALLSMAAGSAAQVLLAWEAPEQVGGAVTSPKFSPATLARVRRRGWAASVAEREPGLASVSAPVRDARKCVAAAVSVSGPVERMTRSPGQLHARAVVQAADALTRAMSP